MSTVKSYIKMSIAFLKGNPDEVIFEKNRLKLLNEMRSQKASTENKIMDQKDVVEVAEEDLNAARLNHGELVKNSKGVAQTIFDKKARLQDEKLLLEELEDRLKNIQEEIDFLEAEEKN